jgi:hypothetical protein
MGICGSTNGTMIAVAERLRRASDRSDQALNAGTLPRQARCYWSIALQHRLGQLLDKQQHSICALDDLRDNSARQRFGAEDPPDQRNGNSTEWPINTDGWGGASGQKQPELRKFPLFSLDNSEIGLGE